MNWPSGVPEEAYEVLVENADGLGTGWMSVADRDDHKVTQLLVWAYNYMVHKTPGNDVIIHESLAFLVHKCEINVSPWELDMLVFDIDDQTEYTVKYRLASK